MKKSVLVLIFLNLLLGCSKIVTEIGVPDEINLEPIVLFCPKDNCGKNLEFLVMESKKSVHCAFYDINIKSLLEALSRKMESVDVKIILDDGKFNNEIKRNVKIDDKNGHMHNKFCIFDGSAVWTGSFNPTENDDKRNNNNVIILYSKIASDNFEDEFNELWNGNFHGGNEIKHSRFFLNDKLIENFFCPEDCGKNNFGGIYRVIELIRIANKSVKVASFSFTHEEVADSLIFADIRGINVSVIVEKRQKNILNSQFKRLKDFGLKIREDGTKYNMHHKFIIIDDKIVVTGSVNYTLSGNNRNDENMLIIFDEEIALKYKREFDWLFENGT